MAIDEQKIGPAIVIDVEEHRAPTQILRVEAQSGGEYQSVECSVSVVVVERGVSSEKLVLKMSSQPSLSKSPTVDTHARLLAAIFVVGRRPRLAPRR